jgi:Tfp pilus assembly protein PilF
MVTMNKLTLICTLIVLSANLQSEERTSIVPARDHMDEVSAKKIYTEILTYDTFTELLAVEQIRYLISQLQDDQRFAIESKINQLKTEEPHSLVPSTDQIDDFSARRAYAKILTNDPSTVKYAIEQYDILTSEHPDDQGLILESKIARLKLNLSEQTDENTLSLVSKSDWISDNIARFTLAELYSFHKRTYLDSIQQYLILLSEDPNNPKLLLPLAEMYLKERFFDHALYTLNQVDPESILQEDIKLSLKLAQLEASLGYATKARDYFDKIITKDNSEKSQISYADAMMSWGDFYRAEKIYDQASEDQSETDKNLTAVKVLIAMQRFDEAIALSELTISEHPDKQVVFLTQIAEIKQLLGDYSAALEYSTRLMDLTPEKTDPKLSAARALYHLKSYNDAIALYLDIQEDPDFRPSAQIGAGRCYQKLVQTAEAETQFLEAAKDNYSRIEAQFYLDRNQVTDIAYVDDLIKNASTAQELEVWANLYAAHGSTDIVERICRTSLVIDPDFFPAHLGLADALSGQREYAPAITIYSKLLNAFPDDLKLLIGKCRLLSWDKQFIQSVLLYEDLIDLNPSNPVPLLEIARVAYWRKVFPLSLQYYDALRAMVVEKPLPVPVLVENIDLEINCQTYKWDRHPILNLGAYKDLLSLNPGSDYWKYEMAQCYASLGYCDKSKEIYRDILDNSPSNTQAGMALERAEMKVQPKIALDYTYWSTKGYGDLDQVGRYEFNTTFTYCPSCREQVVFAQRNWIEHTYFDNHYHHAVGQTLEWNRRFTGYFSAQAGVTHKQYNHRYGTVYSCFFNTRFDLWDRLYIDMGFRNRDDVYNIFNLQQKTQEKIWWVAMQAFPTHRTELISRLEYSQYNDFNSLVHGILNGNYTVMEYPGILKACLTVEYRNTAHTNIFIYSPNGTLLNIIHPYWAPQDYVFGQFLLEWRHDYGELQFEEAPVRYYDIKAAIGTDNNDNPFFSVKLEWYHEFYSHWKINVSGFIERSPMWNAKGLWCNVTYQF